MAAFELGPSMFAVVSVVGGRSAGATQSVSRVLLLHTKLAYLESLLNMERNDARFLRVLVFGNDEALDDMECAAEKVDAVEWRCLKFAGK